MARFVGDVSAYCAHTVIGLLALREGRACRVVLRNYRKDGQPFWNNVTIAPVYGTGLSVSHRVGILHDIT
jgi:PAS domain-containing protein